LAQPGQTSTGFANVAASAQAAASAGGALSVEAGGYYPDGGVARANFEYIEDVLITGGSGPGTFQSDWSLAFFGQTNDEGPFFYLDIAQDGTAVSKTWRGLGVIIDPAPIFPGRIPHFSVQSPFTFNVPFHLDAKFTILAGNALGPGGFANGQFSLNGFSTLDANGNPLSATIIDVTASEPSTIGIVAVSLLLGITRRVKWRSLGRSDNLPFNPHTSWTDGCL
jgi:hypothetical protein